MWFRNTPTAKKSPEAWWIRTPPKRPLRTLRELVQILNLPGGHMLVGLLLVGLGLWGVFTGHKEINSFLEMAGGAVIAMLRGGQPDHKQDSSHADPVKITCPNCGHEFDPREAGL